MSKLQPIVALAEADVYFSAGLAAVLRGQMGYGTVLEAQDFSELENLLANNSVAFLTLASDLPGSKGVGSIRRLHAEYPAMRIAMLSNSLDPKVLVKMLSAGAHGVIPRAIAGRAELLRALQSVSDEGTYVPEVGADGSYNSASRQADALTKLTNRQRQFIGLVSEGHSNKVIARKLGIAPSTVKIHAIAVYRALGVHSRRAAAAALRRAGGNQVLQWGGAAASEATQTQTVIPRFA